MALEQSSTCSLEDLCSWQWQSAKVEYVSQNWKSNCTTVRTLLSLETARLMHPLYSSGFFLTNASMKLVAAVTTPMCWSFSRWIILEVHSPPGMISVEVRNSRSKHSAADCFTTSMVSLKKHFYWNSIGRDRIFRGLPRDEQLWNVMSESLGHFLAADVGNALKGKIHVDGVSRLQIVLDALVDEVDQVTPRVDKHRYEEITLNGNNLHLIPRTNYKTLTICFSEYLLEESKLTASMWPKSMSWPSKKMNSSLQTYFFFW